MSSEISGRRLELAERLADAVRANQRATDVVDELLTEVLGVNRTDGRCLDILHQHGRLSAGQLAEESSLSTGAITAVIDRLERAGYVERVADPSDRRRVLVAVTDKSRELACELMGKPMAEAARPLIHRYSEQDLELLLDFTRRGIEIQQRHADWLRERLAGRKSA
jgi:DNA-binding MarR family transcriptional regulator